MSFPIKFFKLSYFKMMTLSLTFTVVVLAAKNIIAYYGYSNAIKDSEMISTIEAISVANVDGDLYTEQELEALKDADREEEAKEKIKKKQDMRRKHAKPLIKVDHAKSRMKSRKGIKKKKKNIRV